MAGSWGVSPNLNRLRLKGQQLPVHIILEPLWGSQAFQADKLIEQRQPFIP